MPSFSVLGRGPIAGTIAGAAGVCQAAAARGRAECEENCARMVAAVLVAKNYGAGADLPAKVCRGYQRGGGTGAHH